MCLGSGSSAKTQTTAQNQTSTTTPTGAAFAAYQGLLPRAQSVSETAWNPATGSQVAGFTPDQLNAFSSIRGGIAQPYIDNAASLINNGSGSVAGNIDQYMNPYTQNLINATQADFDRSNAKQLSDVTGNARLAGSLGGDREQVAKALTAGEQARVQNPIIANMRTQGYNTALSAAQNDAARSLTGGSAMGNLSQLSYSDINALLGIGGQQQANQQAQLDANTSNAQAESSYPFQTTQWLAGILGAATPNMGSTTTSTGTSSGVSQGPTPNTWSQAIGGGLALASLLASGGRIGRAGGGYVPDISTLPQGSRGIQPAQAMSFPMGGGGSEQQKGFADHWREIQDTAKATKGAATGISNGLNDLGKWMNSSTTPGGWNTTTDYGNTMSNLSAGIQNVFGLAMGGKVRADGGAVDDNDPAGSYDIAGTAPRLTVPLMEVARARQAGPEIPIGGIGGPSSAALDTGNDPAGSYDAERPLVGAPPGAGEPYAPPPPTLGQGPLNPNGAVAGASYREPAQAQPSGIMGKLASIPERLGNWVGTEDYRQTLLPMGLAMMAASREGGKGTTGVHLGIGGLEGLKSQNAYREGERKQAIEQQKMGLLKRAQEIREAEEGRAAAMHPYDIQAKQAQVKATNALATTREDPTKIYSIRAEQAAKIGLDPKSEAYRDYVLTGKIGKEELSATAQKQILESEESNAGVPLARQYVKEALELNKKATEGAFWRFYAQSIDPNLPASMRTDTAQATRSLDRTMLGNVLGKLKETFGAAPTEGERKILVDLETAMNQTAKDREGILQRALAELDKRERYNTRILEQLRGKTLFKPQAAPSSAAPAVDDPLGIRQ